MPSATLDSDSGEQPDSSAGQPRQVTTEPGPTAAPDATAEPRDADSEVRDAPAPDAGAGRRRRWMLVGSGVAAAWVLPVGTHLMGVDWLLPVVIWVLTASLLRSGRSLLDKLVLAAVLLVGAVSVAGLVLSVWPWGLQPVPVAGTALTGLVLIAVLLRRRPSLPLTPRGSDLAALGSGLLAAAVLLLPYLGRNFERRISLVILGEDMARHFSLYDSIGLIEKYAFFDRHESAPYLLYGMQTYPQGSHFLYALLDKFLRNGAPAGDSISSFDHYVGFHIAGYAAFAVLVFWAARWVTPGTVHGWPKVAIYTFVMAAVTFSELIAMFVRGYPGEIMGLALLAVLIALVARPPRYSRELIVMFAALLIGISWAYFFLLPISGAIAIAALIGHRRRVLRHWLTTLVAAAVAIPMAFMPYVLMYTDRVSALADLLPRGPVEGVNRPLTVGIAALLLAGLAAAPRSPVWRMMGVQLVIVASLTILLGVYQLVAIGHLSYYFDKAGHALFVATLVGLSGVTPLLARIHRRTGGRTAAASDRRRRLLEVAVAVLVVFGIFAGFGAVPLQRPSVKGNEPIRNVSWGTAYAVGHLQNRRVGMVVDEVLRRYPEPDGRLTQVIMPHKDHSYLSTLFVSVLHRDYGTLIRVPKSATPLYFFEDTDVTVPDFPLPRRIIVINSPESVAQLREILDTRPDLDVELISIEMRLND
ncbi:MAG: hypothetical protein ACRDTM_08860 [Micromonosporaceae bacterium]